MIGSRACTQNRAGRWHRRRDHQPVVGVYAGSEIESVDQRIVLISDSRPAPQTLLVSAVSRTVSRVRSLVVSLDIYGVTSLKRKPQAIASAQHKLNSQHGEPNRRDGAATTPAPRRRSLPTRPQHPRR